MSQDLKPFPRDQLVDAIYWALKMARPGTKQAYYQGNEHRRDLAAKMLAAAVADRLQHVTMFAADPDMRPPFERLQG